MLNSRHPHPTASGQSVWIHGRRGLTGTKPLPAQGASPGVENGQPRPARTSPRPRERLTSPTRKDCPAGRSPPGLVGCDLLASPRCTRDTRPGSPGGKASHKQGAPWGPAVALSTPRENQLRLEASWEEGGLKEVTEGELPTRLALPSPCSVLSSTWFNRQAG